MSYFFADAQSKKVRSVVISLNEKLGELHKQAMEKYSKIEGGVTDLGVSLEPLHISVSEWEYGLSISVEEDVIFDDQHDSIDDLSVDWCLERYRGIIRERARAVGIDC